MKGNLLPISIWNIHYMAYIWRWQSHTNIHYYILHVSVWGMIIFHANGRLYTDNTFKAPPMSSAWHHPSNWDGKGCWWWWWKIVQEQNSFAGVAVDAGAGCCRINSTCNPCPQSKLTLHIPHCAMHIVQYTVRCGDCCTIPQLHCCKGGEKQMLQLGDALTPPSVALRILQFDLCTPHLCTALTWTAMPCNATWCLWCCTSYWTKLFKTK